MKKEDEKKRDVKRMKRMVISENCRGCKSRSVFIHTS